MNVAYSPYATVLHDFNFTTQSQLNLVVSHSSFFIFFPRMNVLFCFLVIFSNFHVNYV